MRPPWAGPSLLDKALSFLGLAVIPKTRRGSAAPGWAAGSPSVAAELEGIAKEVARLAQRVAELERDLGRRGG